MMILPIHGIDCHGTALVKLGKTPEGKQRYRCRGNVCSGRTFILDYSRPGSWRSVKQQIVDMAMNGSGFRDTARVLHVSPNTVTRELKKESQLLPVNLRVLKQLNPEQIEVEII